MGWPQIAMIVFMGMSIGGSLYKHGEPRTGRYSIFSALFGVAIEAWLLWEGGFFG